MTDVTTNNFDLWTSALLTRSSAGRRPNGAPEAYGIRKLRELILELAVRGKLVPQNSNDEPAGVLLDRIKEAKARLIDEGKIRRQKPFPEIAEEEKHYELPEGWAFARLGDLAFSQAGFAFKSTFFNEDEQGLPLIRIRDVGQPFSGTYYSGDYREDFLVNNGDYLISMDGEFRVSSWGNGPALLNQRVSRLIFFDESVGKRFIADSLQAQLHEFQGVKAYTTVDHLSGEQIAQSVIGLPPLAEQHRIVAKVDELMALCDELEHQQTRGLDAHEALVETLLRTLTASPQDLTEAWTRIANYFDTLFTTEHSIDQLKQTILQLAVMGRLVPQDPNDEPASVLLETIAKRKDELVEQGKLKRQSAIPRVSKDETHFEPPPGWEFVRFGTVTFNRDAERVPLSVEERRNRQGEYDYYGASGVIDSIDDFLFDKPLLLIGEDGANLINRSTPIAFMARGKYWVNNHAHVLDGLTEDLLLYICLHINAISLEPYVTGTAQPKMNQAKMNTIVLALPPAQEQQRIVARVDELMALCDALKARLADAQTTHAQLADAIVERALA